MMRRSENMIIARIEGGVGNQMFQYAMARRIAQLNRSELKLDIGWFTTQAKREYELHRFNIVAEIADEGDVSSLLGAGAMRSVCNLVERFKPYDRRRLITERSFRFNERFGQIGGPAYLQGYWQSPLYFSGIEELLRREFTLKEPLSIPAQRIQTDISNVTSVGVHFRRGDYLTDVSVASKHGTCALTYYIGSMQIVIDKFPHAVFFCFSDDQGWVRKNVKFPGAVVFVDLPPGRGSVEELFLLSQCEHHIISNSTFGWWGAWLGRMDKDALTLAPKRWFLDRTIDTSRLFPSEWILIEL